ncbi:polyisoprenoid-binding protein [Nonomuraea phyllanthi]|uniref:Polyisoprenoid-binding protein n=1 Tax=Nonomuraea phyllanthi TaxID=2219224 RepID=A0A5C4URS6_9ACTN|nr:YceI family protein [Nonomuraea phyllanthi]KAB8181514.1 polyisoprenoid-binding protein [Nonomuraea phyllanthi]
MEHDMYPSELTGTYTIDPAHSRFGFVARHAMVTKVRGSFPVVEATAHLDAADPAASTVRVTLDASGVDTGNPQRDGHLRTVDFLDAETHPHITFTSTGVKHVDEDAFEVTGRLTIRGVTREITIPLEFAGTAVDAQGFTRAGFEGSTVINRKDYGVSFNAVLETGGVMISEKITLEFDLSAVKNA